MTIKVLTMVNQFKRKMALILIFMAMIRPCFSNHREEMALANVTRFASGDLFSLVGPECGLTRCMEVSHGTALAAMGVSGCSCQCARDTPAFREDQKICVNHIDECRMASYGRGATKPQIPFVFLPLKGQIVYPAKEIVFTDVEDAVCAVTSAQYLSPSGWLALRDLVDNDVPFALYRDEGSTYLQWRGSSALHGRLEGRLVTVHVLCSAPAPARLAASCASFRVAGATHNTILDVRSIPFHAGEIVNTEQVSQSKGLSVLEYLAIGVCVLMVIFIYAAGIIFYIHYKQKQKRKAIDPELNRSRTASTENISTIDMDNVRLKKNPLLNLDNMQNDFLNDAGLSDVSERTEDTLDSSTNFQKQFQNPNIVSAMIHTHRKKPSRPSLRTSTPERLTERLQRRSASPEIEKAPQSDLSIIDCSVETNSMTSLNPPTNVEPVIRRKLYFNPVFFEVEHLKNPPPAAIDFLIKIREIMAIAKEKMLSKRFIPMLSDIPEEDLYHTLDLGWNIPCARRGRRFSAISLKRENSRRAVHCGGCPGCDSSDSKSQKAPGLIRSNSCKTCVSDDYKQRIVQKWLDEVPSPPQTIRPTKSIAKVSGTPRIVDTKKKDDVRVSPVIPIRRDESHANKQEVRKPIESGSREKLSNLRVKETIDVKRDLDKPKTIISNQDNNRNEKKLTSPPSNKKPQEKRSPSSNATRRVVRKKLPPPPPPPVNPQEPVTPDKKEPVLPEVKVKMEAVIKELNKCKRSEEGELEELRRLAVLASGPKIVIPVVSADSQYYSDDNTLTHDRKATHLGEISMEFDSLERNILKRRRFSLDFGSEIIQKQQTIHKFSELPMERLSRSWRDIKKAVEATPSEQIKSIVPNISTCRVNDLYMNPIEPLYNNIETPGPLTIEVRGSPVDIRQKIHDDFDPDTLDRKPRREMKKSVEKILLKSGGSFKNKIVSHNANYDFAKEGERKTPPEAVFTRKIGSLRQIYEAKAKAQQEPRLYERRSSLPYANHDIAKFMKSVRPSDFRKAEGQSDPKPPIPPKQRRGSEKYSPPSERQRSEEKERVTQYIRSENLNVRRSGRRSSRTRSRRVDLKKLCRTEDSGYLSTDSNESKCRARYMMLRPKFLPPEPAPKPVPPVVRTLAIQIESDTDEMESLCDGRSESGGESVETDSVFFGNFDESKEMYSELGLCVETRDMLAASQDQIDSGFVGETNIILSGDSDSEHRSVISIVTGRDGRSSVASITKLDDTPYVHSVEC